MKKTLLLKTMLLLCALVAGSFNAWADEVTYTVSSKTAVTTSGTAPTGSSVTFSSNGNTAQQLTSGTGQTLTLKGFSGYKITALKLSMRSNSSKGEGTLSYSNDGGLSFTYLVGTSSSGVRFNNSAWYGAWSTDYVNVTKSSLNITCGESDVIFKIEATANSLYCQSYTITYESDAPTNVTSLSVSTAPTKLNYKVGEALDLTGLVLEADGNDVTSGYTASPANGTTLNTVGAQTVTFTYGGQTTSTTVYVGELSGIAITTPPTKTEYNQGQTFDPAGMVVTATYNAGGGHTWAEVLNDNDYTYSPDGALGTSDTEITISYGGKTATQNITVNAATAYTVTFNAGAGTCGTASLTEATGLAGVILPTATISLTGWSFAGWAEAAVANTEVAPTLYAAGEPYHPTDNCTLYAVYSYSDVSTTTYKRATALTDITSAGSVVIVSNSGSQVMKNNNGSFGKENAPTETSGLIEPTGNMIFTLSGDNSTGYTLTNSSLTLGAENNNASISFTTDNNVWAFEASTSGTNNFAIANKSWSGVALQYYNNFFKVYNNTNYATMPAFAMRVYVPAWVTVYNSNPATIINPTVAFKYDGGKLLYVQNTNTYDNPATVTGISKTATYESSNETVATVSDAGVVTALKAGNATITAKVAAEAGVNTEATASYEVTVKDASNIAGLKAITSSSTAVTFTANLTDAVVTYVKDNHAYIQDASGAVYASCGGSLTAGKKISGPVSGSVKAANQIDEITAIDLVDATLTDGDIPAAAVLTAATLAANKADYEGKLVQIANATVTASLSSGSASGGKISDDNKTTEINLYAPNSNIEALKDAEGTFNGYITLYGGSTIRFNIYEQSQITLTKNAPTTQTLSFAEDAVELDEVTDALTAFTGQTVNGASTTVTYSKVDEDNIIDDFNTSTGALTLTGACGTATITATAAAEDIFEGGVTTPYQEATKSYTITVYPRYIVTFSVNGVETTVRQAAHGEAITVPVPADINDYKFVGWSTSTVAATDTKPELASLNATITPENNSTKYYAVFAKQRAGGEEEVSSTLDLKQSEPSNPSTIDGVTWSWSNVTFSASGNTGMEKNKNATVTFTLPSTALKANKIQLNCPNSMAWGGDAAVVLKAGDDQLASMKKDGSYTFTSDDNNEGTYTMSQTTSANAWINSFTLTYAIVGTENYDYRTSLDVTEVTISDSKYLAFCYGSALDFSNTDVKAYTAKVDGGKVKLTQVDEVPAETGVVLYCETPGTYEIPVIDNATALSNNEMVGVLERTQVLWNVGDKYNYILQQGKFNMATNGYLKANRAYLSTEYDVTTAGTRSMEIFFDEGETTGIADNNRETITNNGSFFDLQGRKVANPTKGLYIVNGKKVVVK